MAAYSDNVSGEIKVIKDTADTQFAVDIKSSDSSINIGPGGTTAPDTTIKRTGVNTLDFGNAKLQSVANPVNTQDVATKAYTDTLDGANVKLTGDQSINGLKTFIGSQMVVDNGSGKAQFSGYAGGYLNLFKTSTDSKQALQFYAADSSISLGPGGSTAPDTVIKRTGANVLTFTNAKVTNANVIGSTNTVASSATPSINTDTTSIFTITALAANITSMTTNLTGTPVNGQKLLIRIKDNGTARTIAWGASFVSSGTATLLATTVASKTHMIGLIYDSTASKWCCLAVDPAGY